jgi:hypothetical protein
VARLKSQKKILKLLLRKKISSEQHGFKKQMNLASAGGAIELPQDVLSSTVSGDGESEYDGVADYDPPVEAEESAKDEEEKEILLRKVLTMKLL